MIAIAAACACLARASRAEYVFVTSASEVWRVDLATGDREHLDVDGYPGIIVVRMAAVESDASLLLAGASATQFGTVFRIALPSGTLTPVSGDVFGDPQNLLGDGPGLPVILHEIAFSGEGEAVALGAFRGLTSVDLATGDRATITQSADPPTGEGYPLANPSDFVVLPDGDFLVMELFQGIVHVDRATGDRTLAHPNAEFATTPELIALLPDDRIAHVNVGVDVGYLFAYDPATTSDELLTGDFGGEQRGDGPAFVAPADIAVGPNGELLVFDMAPPAIFAVDPKTGDRTLVSGGAANRGEGFGLPTSDFDPRLAVHVREAAKSAGDAWAVE